MSVTIVNSIIALSLCALITMIFVQVFKTVLNSILIGRLDVKTLLADGDFPSSHTSVLIAFNIVFWKIVYMYHIDKPQVDIFSSVLVGLVLGLWSCYEIRDAMGVRLRVQEHANAIKQIALTSKDMSNLIDELNKLETNRNTKVLQHALDDLLKNLKLKAGHLPHEVVGGIFTGGFIGSLFTAILSKNVSAATLIIIFFVIYVAITITIFVRRRKKEPKT